MIAPGCSLCATVVGHFETGKKMARTETGLTIRPFNGIRSAMASSLVLVTGASSGIGAATARRFGASGAKVLLLARNEDRLDEVATAIRDAGGSATSYPIDLADDDAVAEMSAKIEREAGTPDILINNAGAGRWLPVAETTAEQARAMIEVPYLAAFNLTRAFLPKMIARDSGAIACVTSPASFVVWPSAGAYTAARHALLGFTESLRADLKGTGISVTLVVLGVVESPYWEHNPGSRERVPPTNPLIMPPLTTDEAAEAIFAGVERRKRMVVKPAIFRALFLLNAISPRLVASQLRGAVPKRTSGKT
jgi:short-subunit dehydrogenase